MKEKIYTIPVLEGFKEKGECPFCNMVERLDMNAVEYMLGPSYMEDDIRMDTNRQGFCSTHYEKMYGKQNRLGLSLLIHSHLQKINTDLTRLSQDLTTRPTVKKSFFSKPAVPETDKTVSYLKGIEDSCYICQKVDTDFSRFIDTFFYMWSNDKEIRQLVDEGNGFCLKHFTLLMDEAEKKLKPEANLEFLKIIVPKQLDNLKRMEEEVDWFIKKFDYRYQNEPWNNSKDALIRALKKISSLNIT